MKYIKAERLNHHNYPACLGPKRLCFCFKLEASDQQLAVSISRKSNRYNGAFKHED